MRPVAFVTLLGLALSACDSAPLTPVDPFGPAGTWTQVANFGDGVVRSVVVDRESHDTSTLLIAAGRAGAFAVDVSAPGRPPRLLGFAVTGAAEPSHGVWTVVRAGGDLLVGTNVTITQRDGVRAGLFRSTDEGRTWARSDAGIPGPQNPSSPTLALAVSPNDPAHVIGGYGSSFRSSDGGRTWSLLSDARGYGGDELYTVAWGRYGEAWFVEGSREGNMPSVELAEGGAPARVSMGGDFTFNYYGVAPGQGPDGLYWYTTDRGVYRGGASVSATVAEVRAESVAPQIVGTLRGCTQIVAHPARLATAFVACETDIMVIEGGASWLVQVPTSAPITTLVYDESADALYVGVGAAVYRLGAPLLAPREPVVPRERPDR